MIAFEDALKLALDQAVVLGVESVSFEESPGRVLASPVVSDMDIPPFNKSAMDGFACRREDLGEALRVIEVIRAGVPPAKRIAKGECAQIMTGAIVPEGADTVIKVEECEVMEAAGGQPLTVRFSGASTASNISPRGEDLRLGQELLTAGTLLDVRHVPILATVGRVFVDVYRFPSVGVLSTGTELVEPGEKPGISQIRNSNAYQMIAQLSKMGIETDYYGIAEDDEEVTRNLIAEALDSNDILIMSGGVSMGEFDFVPTVLENLGISVIFKQLAIQPGKPTLFGKGNGKFVFGLPGNPVSSFFILELLVKPFLYKCMGHDWNPVVYRMKSGERIARKKTERLSWRPVRIGPDGCFYLVDYHGSAHIFSLRDATGIIPVPIGKQVIEKGELVDVRPI
jgi:molybdopterin molybdotransferase